MATRHSRITHLHDRCFLQKHACGVKGSCACTTNDAPIHTVANTAPPNDSASNDCKTDDTTRSTARVRAAPPPCAAQQPRIVDPSTITLAVCEAARAVSATRRCSTYTAPPEWAATVGDEHDKVEFTSFVEAETTATEPPTVSARATNNPTRAKHNETTGND